MGRWSRIGAVIVVVAVSSFGLGQASAQSTIPNGVFVRDSAGDVWGIGRGQRWAMPIYPASDDEINAVPFSGQWLVPNASGGTTPWDRPEWAGGGIE